MSLYEVTLRQRYFDQSVINVFNYVTLAGIGVTPTALELITEMGFIPSGDPLAFDTDTLAGKISALQSVGAEFLSVEARELYSLTDFYEAVYSPALLATGGAGEASPPFVAYGLFSSRVRTDIRRGFKRFVGVSETWVTHGGVVTGTGVTALADVAEKMSDVLSGVTAAYAPCVISRQKIVDIDTGRISYELYPTESEQEEHTAVGIEWAGYSTVRSQTSRQYGRGD